jgi:KaiC/GvpD/RAD55 family RecA-like ATPase
LLADDAPPQLLHPDDFEPADVDPGWADAPIADPDDLPGGQFTTHETAVGFCHIAITGLEADIRPIARLIEAAKPPNGAGNILPLQRDAEEPGSGQQLQLERRGLGYRFSGPGIEVTMAGLRQVRGEIGAHVSVARPDRLLLEGRLALSSVRDRETFARILKGRDKTRNWDGLLDEIAHAVQEAESRGEPFTVAGPHEADGGPRYLLEPAVPAGVTTILYGRGGAGKTTLALAMAVSVATQVEIIPGWRPVAPAYVLVLDWENDLPTVSDTVMAIACGADVPVPEVGYRRCIRTFADDLEGIAEHLGSRGPAFLVVDSMGLAVGAASAGGPAEESVERFFRAVRQLGDVTVLGIDHQSKAGAAKDQPGPDSLYGPIYKTNYSRSIFEVRGAADTPRQEVVLHQVKVNRRRNLPPQGLSIIRDPEGSIRLERSDIEAPDLVRTLSVPDRMGRELRAGPLPTSELAARLDVTENTVRTHLARSPRFTRLPDKRIALAVEDPA